MVVAAPSQSEMPNVKVPAEEDRGKQWLAVMIALMAFLVSITTWLQTDASDRAAEWSHRKQESDLQSTGLRTRGQLQTTLANSIVREYDQLEGQATSLQRDDRTLESGAFITAAILIATQSPLLAPPYSRFDETGWRQSTLTNRYEADTWVITATLLSERSEAATKAGAAWDSKSNTYKAAIVVFAVVLFLFALATIVVGRLRWLFVVVGLGLGGVTFLGALVTAGLPVVQTPEAAMQQYAIGYGYTWQGRYDEAVQAYTQALTLYPDYGNALAKRGQAWFHTQPPNVDWAVRDLQAARRLTDNNYSVYWNLGWAYFRSGDYVRSLEASNKALDLNSQICGPAFNVALVRLVMGDRTQAVREYDSAITRCEKIVKGSLAAGLAPPYSLWDEIEAGAEDIENLLCQTHQRHCYPDREQLNLRNVADPDAVLAVGEAYLKRIKEALVALEYLHTASVTPSGARFGPLEFANEFNNDAGEFQSYVIRDRFPFQGPSIYGLRDYTGVKPGMDTVWKVYLDGREETGLRYEYKWDMASTGGAARKIDSWYVMDAGRYDVEMYGDGELMTTGTFVIDANTTLAAPPLAKLAPSAPVSVTDLVVGDDFANNDNGWWSSSGSAADGTERKGTIANGEYSIVSHKPGYKWRVTCEVCGPFDDAYFEATARHVGGPADTGYGLAFRGDRGMDEMYLFLIRDAGEFKVAKVVDGTYVSVTDWLASGHIAPNAPNRLGVLARGSALEFIINGQAAGSVTDASLKQGYVGFSVEAPELEVAFSGVRVWRVP